MLLRNANMNMLKKLANLIGEHDVCVWNESSCPGSSCKLMFPAISRTKNQLDEWKCGSGASIGNKIAYTKRRINIHKHERVSWMRWIIEWKRRCRQSRWSAPTLKPVYSFVWKSAAAECTNFVYALRALCNLYVFITISDCSRCFTVCVCMAPPIRIVTRAQM